MSRIAQQKRADVKAAEEASTRPQQPLDKHIDRPDLLAEMQAVMDFTCIEKHIGTGRDSHGLKHTGFRVLKVQQLGLSSARTAYEHSRVVLRHFVEEDDNADVFKPKLHVSTHLSELSRDAQVGQWAVSYPSLPCNLVSR